MSIEKNPLQVVEKLFAAMSGEEGPRLELYASCGQLYCKPHKMMPEHARPISCITKFQVKNGLLAHEWTDIENKIRILVLEGAL